MEQAFLIGGGKMHRLIGARPKRGRRFFLMACERALGAWECCGCVSIPSVPTCPVCGAPKEEPLKDAKKSAARIYNAQRKKGEPPVTRKSK